MAKYYKQKEMNPQRCDPNIYAKGICVGVYDPSYISGSEMDRLCMETTDKTGKSCDWSSFAGRYALRCLREDQEVIVETFDPLYTALRITKIDNARGTGIYHGE